MPNGVEPTPKVTAYDAGVSSLNISSIELEQPPVPKAPIFWDKSSLYSAEPKVETAPEPKKGVWNSISSAVSGFFTATISWAWGASPAKVVPVDMKMEGGTVEGIASRPNLSKPEVKNLEKFIDITRKMHNRIKSIHEDSATDNISEQIDQKQLSELQLIAWWVIILKDMKKNNENSIIIMNDRLRNLQNSIKSLQNEKKINAEASDRFTSILDITGKIGVVGVALTVGGLVITGAFTFTLGIAAIPAAVLIAQAFVGGFTAFNKLAENIVQAKLRTNQGESIKLNFKLDEASYQSKLTYDDVKLALEWAYKAEKVMLELAQKQHSAQSQNGYTN